jgi:hypothetical protein
MLFGLIENYEYLHKPYLAKNNPHWENCIRCLENYIRNLDLSIHRLGKSTHYLAKNNPHWENCIRCPENYIRNLDLSIHRLAKSTHCLEKNNPH